MTSPRFSPTGMILFLMLALGVAGCESQPRQVPETPADEAQSALPDVVQKAVAIAKEIEADPDAAEEVLERHGLDVEQFEGMIYEISADPELSRAYNAALE
jgi:hypothetical protein